MDEEKMKASIIAVLMKMSMADNVIAANEMGFIQSIAKKIGVDFNTVNEVSKNLDDHDLEIPPAEPDRMSIFYYLLFLMKIDSNASQKEQNLAREIGVRLGFRDTMVDNMVAVIKQYENSRVPEDALIKNIKQYLN